jgi:hypothetical protein
MRDALAERGKTGEDRQVLLAILAIAADPAIPDEQVGGLIRGEAIGWERRDRQEHRNPGRGGARVREATVADK